MTSKPTSDRSPLLVLDDDPTGAQALSDARVLLRWDGSHIGDSLGRASIHLLTDTRARARGEVGAVIADAVHAARRSSPGSRIVMRGDSTLRGHVLEEYAAFAAASGSASPPLLLVPALPAAGRVTLDGVHVLRRDGGAVPLHDTEYAADGPFAYRSSHLLTWAEERSAGLFARADGREIALASLRAGGPRVVADALIDLASLGRPAVCAPDAETAADLVLIAQGLALAESSGAVLAVRCAPAFVGALAGNTAPGLVPMPTGPAVVICGSYVPATTRQLERLRARPHVALIEVDVHALAAGGQAAQAAVAASARAADDALSQGSTPLVATPRERPDALADLSSGAAIARGLAMIVATMARRPEIVISKGGITSAAVMRDGFGAIGADVVGPVAPGVSLWRPDEDAPRTVGAYIVVPGNVGDDSLLADLVGGTS